MIKYTINKKSVIGGIHLALIDFGMPFRYNRQLRNGRIGICSLFWATVWSLLVFTCAVSFGLCIAAFLLSVLLAPFINIFVDLNGYLEGAALVGSIVWFVAGLAYIWRIAVRDIKAWRRKFQVPARQRPPSLLFTYLKAKKERFCPLVKVK